MRNVVSWSESPTGTGGFRTTAGFSSSDPGDSNAFVAELNPSGPTLVYPTYLGGGSARSRGPDFDRVARRPAAAAGGARAPARLWAGFVLSGLGR
jgi:hypothetical protein